jgi:hypothetical protein
VNTYSTPVFTPVDTYSAHTNLPLHAIHVLVQLREGYLLSAGKEIKVRFKDLTWILRTAPVCVEFVELDLESVPEIMVRSMHLSEIKVHFMELAWILS